MRHALTKATHLQGDASLPWAQAGATSTSADEDIAHEMERQEGAEAPSHGAGPSGVDESHEVRTPGRTRDLLWPHAAAAQCDTRSQAVSSSINTAADAGQQAAASVSIKQLKEEARDLGMSDDQLRGLEKWELEKRVVAEARVRSKSIPEASTPY